METEELQKMLCQLIDYHNEIVRGLFIVIAIGMVGIIAVTIIIYRGILKKYLLSRAAKISIVIICFLVMTFFLIRPYQTALQGQEMLYALKADLKDPVVVEKNGTVTDSFGFTKGGTAVVVNDEIYYLAPQLSNMQIGKEYSFKYLYHSKRLIAYELLHDEPIPSTSKVTDEMLCRFIYEPQSITTNYDAEDLAYQYAKQYYSSINNDIYQLFIDTGWTTSGYFIEKDGIYRCTLTPRKGNTFVYIVLDANTSCPLFFWQVGEDF